MGWSFGTSDYKEQVEINVGEEVSFSIYVYDSSTHHFRVVKSINSQSEELYSDKTVSGNSSYSFQHTFNEVGVYTVSCSEIGTQGAIGVTVTVTGSVTHDYALSFDESSYNTCNGSVTVTATLTDNNNPVEGETISLTGTGSTVTATTDNNGVATFSLTNINENKTLTASYGNVSDTVNIVYNDTSTLNGSLVCLGKKMASNLRSMGVSNASASDGLSTLAGKILNIDPSIGGIDFDTSITCVASSNNVDFGDTVTFTGVLEADYNDTSSADVDLEGFLSGATVKIYDGQTLLGTAVTDSNGAYSFQYTTTYDGTLSIIAYFDGTTYYDACHSNNVSVVVNPIVQLSVTADKPVLSAEDSETATITATLTQSGSGYEGETLTYQIKQGSTVIDSGSDTTDSNGEISFSYAATGIGNVDVVVSYGILLQEIYGIEDCYAYVTSFTNWTSVTNKNTDFLFSPFQLPTNHRIEYKLKNTNGCQIACGDTTHIDGSGYLYWIYAWYENNQRLYTRNSNMYDQTHSMSYTNSTTSVFALECSSNSLTLYKDSTVLKTATTYDTVGLTRLLRLTSSYSSNIDWIKVKAL